MQISIDRDSVCAGDDMMSHEITYLLTEKNDKTVAQFLNESQKSYLPQMGVWVLWANQTELLAWNAKPDKTYYTGAYAQRKLSSLIAPQSHALKLIFIYFSSTDERAKRLYRSYKDNKEILKNSGLFEEYLSYNVAEEDKQRWASMNY